MQGLARSHCTFLSCPLPRNRLVTYCVFSTADHSISVPCAVVVVVVMNGGESVAALMMFVVESVCW